MLCLCSEGGARVRVGRKLWKSLNEVYVDGRGTTSFRGLSRKGGVRNGSSWSFRTSHSMVWSISYGRHLSPNRCTGDLPANPPRAALRLVEATPCTLALGGGGGGAETPPCPLSSGDPCAGCIPQVAVPFLTCVWAKESAWASFSCSLSRWRVWSLSPRCQHYGCFLRKR